MGITKPSLYAAFGNKEELFRKALDLYQMEKVPYFSAALEASTARDVAERLLNGVLESQCSSDEPCGAMITINSMACGVEAVPVRADVIARGASAQRLLDERLERARDEGELPDHINVAGLSRYLMAIVQGMIVLADAGALREELEAVVRISLAVWPSA